MKIHICPVLVIAALLGGLCPGASGQLLKQGDLRRVYGKKWIVLPQPDSKMTPGSIVQVKRGDVLWLSHVKSCGAPETALVFVDGAGGKVDLKRGAQYGADAALTVAGVEIGPEWKKVRNTALQHDEHGGRALDLVPLGEWLNNPSTKLPGTCEKLLSQGDVFIVHESYQVTKGSFTFLGDNGGKINLKGLSLGPVKLSANASAKVADDGSLTIEKPVYTAIRRLRRTKDGGLQTLGAPAAEKDYQDEVARRMAYQSK